MRSSGSFELRYGPQTGKTMANRKLLLLVTGLALVGTVGFLWLKRQGSAAGRLYQSSEAQDGSVVNLADVPPSYSVRKPIPGSDLESARASATTWGARVVARGEMRTLAGVAVEVVLLSPDTLRQRVSLVSGPDGEVGPIEIDNQHFFAAEVRIEPGTLWAGLTVTLPLTTGRANHDVLELAPPAVLTVRVLDTVSNAPAQNAKVAVHDSSGLITESPCDTQGAARLQWKAAGGPFSIRASAPGYAAVSWAELSHPPSEDLQLELLLAPPGKLDIRVQDDQGRSLERCELTLNVMPEALTPAESPQVRAAPARWDPPAETNGVYSFASLPCQVPLVVRARTEDGLQGTVLARIPTAVAFAEITLTIAQAEGTAVWTLDAHRGPLGGTKLGMEREILGVTDELGRSVVALSESRRGKELSAFKSGYAFAWKQWTPEQRDMVYTMDLEGIIAGAVVDSAGRPQRLVRITPLLGSHEEERSTRQRRGELLLNHSGANAYGTDSAGEFAIHGLTTGWMDLHVRPPKGSPFVVRDVLVGTRDLVVTVPDEESLGRQQGLALTIAVFEKSSGAPLPGASVTVFNSPGGKAQALTGGRTKTTKSDGMARLTFAEDGYYLFMVSLEGYVSYQSDVVSYPVGQHRIEVGLSQSCELEILLLNASGIGQPSYWLSAVNSDGEDVSFEHAEGNTSSSRADIMTDVKGRARANRMSPGTLKLEVRAKHGRVGPPLVEREVELRPGERTEVDLRLP